MFGTLRFVLALFVLLNHSPYSVFSFDVAVTSVVVFYLISGYTMGIKYETYLSQTTKPMQTFYLDRFLRIFPLYFIFLLISFCLEIFLYKENFNVLDVVSNFTLIPLNYYMYYDVAMLVPTAFSLALEEQFYLIMPLLYQIKSLIRPILVVSSAIVLGAVFLVFNKYNSKMYSDFMIYRLLHGTIIIFILGISLNFNSRLKKFIRTQMIHKFIYLLYLIVFVASAILNINHHGNRIFAVSFGILVGVPLVLWLKDFSKSDWDEQLGHLSYGVFLNHSIIYKLVSFVLNSNELKIESWLYNLVCSGLSVLVSYMLYLFIEKNIQLKRKHIVSNFIKKNAS